MRTHWLVSGLTLLALLAGCGQATPYQPARDGYGYGEQQIEDNRYRVAFAGNELTTAEALAVVRQLAELRVREVALIGGEAYLREDWDTIAQAWERFLCCDRSF